MKWIKTRQQWLSEAKVRDVIFPKQAKEVAARWGEKFLEYQTPDVTDNIKQGKFKLEEEDKMKVLSAFFDCNMSEIIEFFKGLPDRFNTVIQESINPSLLKEDEKVVLHELNIQAPTVDQIVFIYENVFRKLAISETQASEMIQKGEDGRPVRDEEGQMIRIKKNAGDPIFTNNLVNINTFVDDYNRCYPDEKVPVSGFQTRSLSQLRNLAKENHNRDYKFEYVIFDRDLYLEIDHNPKDILNMSISKFYASCQHLYSGGYRDQLLGNVFDPNSIPAFLVFDTPILWDGEKISDKLPLSRMMIRNIESFDSINTEEGEENELNDKKPKIFFDRAYPDRMREVFIEMVEKYTPNKQNVSRDDTYLFTPDIDLNDDKIRDPYMDNLGLRRADFIGKNTKTLYLNKIYDWSKVKISPLAKVKEVIIETTDIPENFLELPMSLEWIKFKFLKIKTLSGFDKVKTDSIAFDKCKLSSSVLDDINEINPNIKRIQLISSQVVGDFDFSKFNNLEELQLIFPGMSIEELRKSTENLKVKKLTIDDELLFNEEKEFKQLLNDLRRKGIKVELVGISSKKSKKGKK
jgi:hypothetical protein